MDPNDRLIDAAVIAAGLKTRYSQAHREYHNLTHVEHVLRQLDLLEHREEDALALRLATWFHDAIYAPGRSDNEERSAFLARDTLELVGASPQLGHEVARLVLLTQTHDPAPHDLVGAVFSDADLSILGSPSPGYDNYASAIREEYSLVADDAFRAGRARVLQQFLDRPAIFRTATGSQLWEEPATANLERELAALTEHVT